MNPFRKDFWKVWWRRWTFKKLDWQSRWLEKSTNWWTEKNSQRNGLFFKILFRFDTWLMNRWHASLVRDKEKRNKQYANRKVAVAKQGEELQKLELENSHLEQELKAFEEINAALNGKKVSQELANQIDKFAKQKKLTKIKDEILQKAKRLPEISKSD